MFYQLLQSFQKLGRAKAVWLIGAKHSIAIRPIIIQVMDSFFIMCPAAFTNYRSVDVRIFFFFFPFAGIQYNWARQEFPHFVQEDKRLFVSMDGNLYFTALEKSDAARYSCNVQSVISSTGRTGPFFPLSVNAAC